MSLLSQNLIYSSPRIFERRRRILEEARRLLSECGYERFGIRELCLRAQVAPQTVYKAFENKERLIALAIRHHFETAEDQYEFTLPKDTLDGVMERIIVVDNNTTAAREYSSALVTIYFSQTAQQDLQAAARFHIVGTLEPWASALRERGHLRRGFSPERLVNSITHLVFGAALEWSRGSISNDEFLLQRVLAVLLCGAGATRGSAQKEISVYLTDALGKRTFFDDIRRRSREGQKALAS